MAVMVQVLNLLNQSAEAPLLGAAPHLGAATRLGMGPHLGGRFPELILQHAQGRLHVTEASSKSDPFCRRAPLLPPPLQRGTFHHPLSGYPTRGTSGLQTGLHTMEAEVHHQGRLLHQGSLRGALCQPASTAARALHTTRQTKGRGGAAAHRANNRTTEVRLRGVGAHLRRTVAVIISLRTEAQMLVVHHHGKARRGLDHHQNHKRRHGQGQEPHPGVGSLHSGVVKSQRVDREALHGVHLTGVTHQHGATTLKSSRPPGTALRCVAALHHEEALRLHPTTLGADRHALWRFT